MTMNQFKFHFKKERRNFSRVLIGIGIVLTGIGFLAGPAASQDLDLFSPEFFSLKNTTIGLGAGLAPDYEGADDFKAVPVPQFRYSIPNGCYLSLLGPSLRVNMIPSRRFGLGPMLRYRPARDSVDDDVVDQFTKIDSTIEAGVFSSVVINHFVFYTAYNKDTSDSHDGYLIDAAGGYRIGIESDVQLMMLAIGTFASDEYMETYFGVNEENSYQSGLPEYVAEAGIKDVGILAALQYKIDKNWAILGIMKYTRLLGDAADSPIVDKRGDANNFMDAIIINYSF
jgi:MipA family protein